MTGTPSAGRPRPRVTVVITVQDRVEYTVLCLQSIEESQAGLTTPFEVVVVDDASQDETPSVLAAVSGDVRTVRNERRAGTGASRNQGAALSTAEHVLFLDGDTFVLGDWLDVLVAAMDDDQALGAAQPKLLYPDGRLNSAGGLVFRGGETAVVGRGSELADDPAHSVRRSVDHATGACLIVRRSAFEEAGGYDPRYAGTCYEDVQLSFQLRSRGHVVLLEPAALVLQGEGAARDDGAAATSPALLAEHRAAFAREWAQELADRPAAQVHGLHGPTSQSAVLRTPPRALW